MPFLKRDEILSEVMSCLCRSVLTSPLDMVIFVWDIYSGFLGSDLWSAQVGPMFVDYQLVNCLAIVGEMLYSG